MVRMQVLLGELSALLRLCWKQCQEKPTFPPAIEWFLCLGEAVFIASFMPRWAATCNAENGHRCEMGSMLWMIVSASWLCQQTGGCLDGCWLSEVSLEFADWSLHFAFAKGPHFVLACTVAPLLFGGCFCCNSEMVRWLLPILRWYAGCFQF